MRQFFSAVIFSAFLCFQGFASDARQFVSVIDAGSTGSRIHVYEVTEQSDASLPSVREIYKEKVNVPLSNFANQPREAGPALASLIQAAEREINKQGDHGAVPLYIYSTAGMRLLPVETQKEINTALQAYVEQSFPLFQKGGVEVRTISGEEEGFFGWLSLNDANHSLGVNAAQTVGFLEMGGASTQVAFTVPHVGQDIFSFQLQGRDYYVLSHSFLGVGHRSAMDGLDNLAVCYPTGAPIDQAHQGDYNYSACRATSYQYLNRFHLAQQTGVLPQNMRFFGVSAFYYTFFFFEVPMTEQGLDALQSTAQQVCSGSWEEMKKKYPSQKQDYLKEYCFAAAYDFTVLSSYGFSSSPTSPPLSIISDRLNNQVVDWSEGLVISRYLKNMKWTNTPGPLSVSY